MITIFMLFERTNILILKIMFHIWYLLGIWLSSYITIGEDEADNNLPLFSINNEENWLERAKDTKK